MGNDLSPEIEVLREPDRILYRLPPRDLGKWRRLGAVPLVIGAWIVYQALTFAGDALLEGNRPPQWPDIAFATVAALVGLGIACLPLGLGLAILWGRREIVLSRGKLRTTERAGPLWLTRRWPIARIERMGVIGLSGGMEPPPTNLLARFDALVGTLREGKRFMIAPAFPRALLEPLARDLATTCDRLAREHVAEPPDPIVVTLPSDRRSTTPRTAVADKTAPADVVGDESDDEQGESARGHGKPRRQPSDSRVTVERVATGLTLTIPRAGMLRGSHGLFAFGLIWCGLLGLMTAVMVASGGVNFDQRGWLPLGFVSLFWLVGIGMLTAAVNTGRRRAAIAVVDGELLVLQTSIFRSKSRQWPAGSVASVQVGPSGIEVNDRPVLELQVFSTSGDKLGLLAGRDVEELRWLADEVRHSLHLAEPERPGAVAEIMRRDVADQPPGSRIAIDRLPQGFSLTIPAAGIRRGSHGFVNLGLFLAAVMVAVTAAEIAFRMSPVAHPLAVLFTLLGWAVAGAILVAGINMGTRRAAVGVADDRLLIVQTSLFGSKKREYAPDEVTAVRAAPSGQSKDFEGLVELQVVTQDGRDQSFLCGEDKNELFWIATLIRQALDVPAELPDEAGEEEPQEVEDDEPDAESDED